MPWTDPLRSPPRIRARVLTRASELASGIAEVVKYGLIRDAPFFEWLEANVQKVMALDVKARLYARDRSDIRALQHQRTSSAAVAASRAVREPRAVCPLPILRLRRLALPCAPLPGSSRRSSSPQRLCACPPARHGGARRAIRSELPRPLCPAAAPRNRRRSPTASSARASTRRRWWSPMSARAGRVFCAISSLPPGFFSP